ncbi:MAG: Crp/Fnr family transcriptional regulator [Deltaproteobacteria bacterium]|nr:Crp/Fnr family transcriptional regulator [Deltaproteobacteria bacterium]
MGRQEQSLNPTVATFSCHDCMRRSHNEWNALTSAETAELCQARVPLRHGAGAMVCHQGEPSTGVYCVVSGTVALRKGDDHGHSVLLRLVPAGETFGYSDCFAGQHWSASAETMETTELCFIPRRVMNRLLANNVELSRRFQTHLVRDYNSAKETILQQAWLPVRARLAHLLMRLKDHFGRMEKDGTIHVTPPLTRQDMADLLGTRQETIARTLHAMAKDGVLRVRGRTVILTDLRVLQGEIERDAGAS